MLTALISTILLVSSPTQSPSSTLSTTDREAFRDLVTDVLREPDSKLRATLVERARSFQSKTTLTELASILAEGPRIPPGPPKAREVGGKLEQLENFGTVQSGLSFEHDGRVFRYAVDVPASYDGTKRVGLLIDPGHGTGKKSDAKEKAGFLEMFRRHADTAGLGDWLVARTEIIEQIGADGLAGTLPEDEVAATFDAFFRDIAARFSIDCDRVIVNGLSQTGFWAWYLARANPRRFAAILPMSAVTWEVDPYAANFIDARIGVLHGSEDPICPVVQPRSTLALLKRMGIDARYLEVPAAKHEYKVWGREPEMLKALAETPRTLYPKLVSISLETLHQPWCGPVHVEELETVGDGKAATAPTGGVDVVFQGQTVHVYSTGVRALSLVLSNGEVDVEKPVDITWNGKKEFAGLLARDAGTLLWTAGETVDWTATRTARLKLHAP